MQNSESVKIDATTMTIAASPIQAEVVSHGEGGNRSPSPQLEVQVQDVAKSDEVDLKPSVQVGHKRKASTEIDPFCESDDELHPNNNDSQRVNSPPVSAPNADLQVHEQMVPQEGRDSEKVEADKMPHGGRQLFEFDLNLEVMADSLDEVDQEEVEPEGGDKGMPHGGLFKLQLNQGEGIVNPPAENEKVGTQLTHNTVVEADAVVVQNIEVEPHHVAESDPMEVDEPVSAAENNEAEVHCVLNQEADPLSVNEGEAEPANAEEKKTEVDQSSGGDKVEVEVSVVAAVDENENEVAHSAVEEKNEVEAEAAASAVQNKVEPSPLEEKNEVEAAPAVGVKIKVEPPSPENHEAGPSTTRVNEVETSPPVKFRGFRSPINFIIDLNELPPEDDEDENQT